MSATLKSIAGFLGRRYGIPEAKGFTNSTVLGSVGVSTVNGSPVQLWNWIVEKTTPSIQFKLNTWTLDQTGNIIAANSFGPF